MNEPEWDEVNGDCIRSGYSRTTGAYVPSREEVWEHAREIRLAWAGPRESSRKRPEPEPEHPFVELLREVAGELGVAA